MFELKGQRFQTNETRMEFLKQFGRAYQPAPKPCFSLQRLKMEWEQIQTQNHSLWIGLPWNQLQKLDQGYSLKVNSNQTVFEIIFHQEPEVHPMIYGQKWQEMQRDEFILPGDQVALFCFAQSLQWAKNQLVISEPAQLVVLSPRLNPPISSVEPFWPDYFFKFYQTLRLGLLNLGLKEVLTPSLVSCPGTEPALEPMKTLVTIDSKDTLSFLPTSPELSLKKYLSLGWTDIFEFKTCFRNGELTDHHQPEFLMLEWYRAFANLDQIQQDLNELFLFLDNRHFIKGEFTGIKVMSMADLFKDHLGKTLTPKTTKKDLLQWAEDLNIPADPDEDFDNLFHLIFLAKIENQIGFDQPLLVNQFPPSQAALARIDEDGWADRFEIYWRGLELCNAFHELTDPIQQSERFRQDFEKRENWKRSPVPLDREFLMALGSGMPPTGGIALGVERLFLACQNQTDLSLARVMNWKNPTSSD